MKKIELFYGFVIGVLVAILGAYLFVMAKTKFNLFTDFEILRSEQILGKVITLGAILDIILFFVLLKINKELMARGIVLALIILAIITIFL